MFWREPFSHVQAQNELRRKALEELKARLLAVGRRPGRAGAKYAFSFRTGTIRERSGLSLRSLSRKPRSWRRFWRARTRARAPGLWRVSGRNGAFWRSRRREGWSALENWLKAVRERGMEGYLLFRRFFGKPPAVFSARVPERGFCTRRTDAWCIPWMSWDFCGTGSMRKRLCQTEDFPLSIPRRPLFIKRTESAGLRWSPELNEKELAELSLKESELVVYGYQPLMVTAQCLRKNAGGCTGKPGLLWLQDRKKVRFPVKNRCLECGNLIYNSVPLQLGGLGKELLATGAEYFRLEFTIESKGRDGKDPPAVRKAADGSGEEPDQEAYPGTRGHFKRGVE